MKQTDVSHPEFTDLRLFNAQLYNRGCHVGFQNKNPLRTEKDKHCTLQGES